MVFEESCGGMWDVRGVSGFDPRNGNESDGMALSEGNESVVEEGEEWFRGRIAWSEVDDGGSGRGWPGTCKMW